MPVAGRCGRGFGPAPSVAVRDRLLHVRGKRRPAFRRRRHGNAGDTGHGTEWKHLNPFASPASKPPGHMFSVRHRAPRLVRRGPCIHSRPRAATREDAVDAESGGPASREPRCRVRAEAPAPAPPRASVYMQRRARHALPMPVRAEGGGASRDMEWPGQQAWGVEPKGDGTPTRRAPRHAASRPGRGQGLAAVSRSSPPWCPSCSC